MSTNGFQNFTWVSNAKPEPYIADSSFGVGEPASLPMWASSKNPSGKCGDCEHTLICVAMTVYAYSCPRCGSRALWVAELRKWLQPQKPACAHEFIHCMQLCYKCKADEEAFKTLKKMNEKEPQLYTFTTTTNSTAGPITYSTGTTTGDPTNIKKWWE